MRLDSGATKSVWSETVPERNGAQGLTGEISTEVCVIGAGIAGLSVAYELARAGKRVVVVEDGPIGGGETGRTTAHLSNALDDRYTFLEKRHGEVGAQLAAASHTAAIARISEIIEAEKINCDFTFLDGFLFGPPEAPVEHLEEELAAAHRAGLREVEMFDRAPLKFYNTGPCLRFPRQGQFHPLKYLYGLADAVERLGGVIYTGTRATEVEDGEPAVTVTNGGGRIRSSAVVVATNTPFINRVAMHTKQAPYRTYVLGLLVPAGSIPLALYWDTAQEASQLSSQEAPYHYVRLQKSTMPGREVLIVGGEDHKTGQADDFERRWQALVDWARVRFPMAEEVGWRWSGQVLEPIDGMAFIGLNPGDKRVYVATGDSGHGMTHGAIAGMLLRDLVTGRENAWAELYKPSRITPSAAGTFAKENLNVAGKYSELVTPGEISSVDELAFDSGAVMRRGLRKVAVYRDEQGRVHQYSAVCRHLGCIVHWNSAEKSWDCPCHGSRFDKFGKVINGPANKDLEVVSESPKQAKKSRTGNRVHRERT